MSRSGANMFARDIAVASGVPLDTLEPRRVGPRWAVEAPPPVHDIPVRYYAPQARRCAFPRCFAAATTRCSACRRAYCVAHGGDWALEPDSRRECELCARQVAADALDRTRRPSLIVAIAASVVFLFVVGLAVAIDVTVRGHGLVVLWVFAGAFIALALYLDS